jgi:GNAT superfamily N-acetyltransferase
MISLRTPEKEEHAVLSDLCIRSKAHWGYDAAFMAQCREEMTISSEDITAAHFQVVELDGVLIAVASVGLCEDGVEIDLLYVDPDYMGLGAGRKLFQWTVDCARSMGEARLIIVADPHAVTFYERMGAVRIGEYPSGSIPGRMLPQLAFTL